MPRIGISWFRISPVFFGSLVIIKTKIDFHAGFCHLLPRSIRDGISRPLYLCLNYSLHWFANNLGWDRQLVGSGILPGDVHESAKFGLGH
jgi:hypothetical protein